MGRVGSAGIRIRLRIRTRIMTITRLQKIVLRLLIALAVSGCASVKPTQSKPYSASIIDILSGKTILGHAVTDSELPDVNIFAITPQMEAFAKKAVRHSDNYFEKIKSLHVALLSAPKSGGY